MSLLSSGGFSLPWLVVTSLPSASIFTSPFALCISPKDTYHCIRSQPDNLGLSLHPKIFNLITSAKSFFPNKLTLTSSGI